MDDERHVKLSEKTQLIWANEHSSSSNFGNGLRDDSRKAVMRSRMAGRRSYILRPRSRLLGRRHGCGRMTGQIANSPPSTKPGNPRIAVLMFQNHFLSKQVSSWRICPLNSTANAPLTHFWNAALARKSPLNFAVVTVYSYLIP